MPPLGSAGDFGRRFSKSYSDARTPRRVKSPNRYWEPAPVATAVGRIRPNRPSGAATPAIRSANSVSVCRELTPLTVSPFAHNGNTPESPAKWNVPLTARRASRYRLPASGCSRSHSAMRVRRAVPEISAISGATTLKYFLSSKSTLSQGGLPTTHENPPAHPVTGSTAPGSADASPSSGTRKISGNSRCQWKKAYWSRRRTISSCVERGAASPPGSCSPRNTLWVTAGGASSRLTHTNAAHQASARCRACRYSAEVDQSR